MTLWSDLAAKQDLATSVNGTNMSIPLAITVNAVAFAWAGVTVTTSITDSNGTAAPVATLTFTTGASGAATISLTAAQKVTLGAGTTWRYSIVAETADVLHWSIAGQLSVRRVDTPGTSTAGLAATITAGTITIALTAPSSAASTISVTDAGGYFTGTNVETVLAELATSTPSLDELINSTLLASITTTQAGPIMVAPFALQLVAAEFVNFGSATIAASDTNYWELKLQKYNAATGTGGVVIATRTSRVSDGSSFPQRQGINWDAVSFDPTNALFAKDDVLGLASFITGAPGTITSPLVTVRYRPI